MKFTQAKNGASFAVALDLDDKMTNDHWQILANDKWKMIRSLGNLRSEPRMTRSARDPGF